MQLTPLEKDLSRILVFSTAAFVGINLVVIESCRQLWTLFGNVSACGPAGLLQSLGAWLPIVERAADHYGAIGDLKNRGLALNSYSFSWGAWFVVTAISATLIAARFHRASERERAEAFSRPRIAEITGRSPPKSRGRRTYLTALLVGFLAFVVVRASWGDHWAGAEPSKSFRPHRIRLGHEYDLVLLLTVLMAVVHQAVAWLSRRRN